MCWRAFQQDRQSTDECMNTRWNECQGKNNRRRWLQGLRLETDAFVD